MFREATLALPASGRRRSLLTATPLTLEEQTQADNAVFAKAASIRRLSLAPIPTFESVSESNQEPQAQVVLTTEMAPPPPERMTPPSERMTPPTARTSPALQPTVSKLLQRPSTAASAHSRVHQALRRSESEFVCSSKDATVEGFLYSSRFEHLNRGSSSHSRSSSHSLLAGRSRPSSSSQLDPRIRQKLAKVGQAVRAAPNPTSSKGHGASQRDDLVSMYDDSVTTGRPPIRQLDHAAEDRAVVQRKRRCARTFEEMIAARLNEATDAASREQRMTSLLSHGIVSSVLELAASADAATQGHCCRALYYLSQVASARKPMVAHGVVATIKTLSRTSAPRTRQDLAATLCHLSEEHDVVDVLLFEGIEQSLARLFASSSAETKRICALTVFNISVDALTIKHFGDAFAALLVTATRVSTPAAASDLIKAVYNASLAPAFHAALLNENIPRFLLQQLAHVPAASQILALRALVALCDSKANRAQMLSQSFCKLLEVMLASTHDDIQETTLLILLLLSIDDGSRIKLCTWVPAAAIVKSANHVVESCSSSNSTASERLVYLQSCVLRNLCDSVLTHHELIEEGVVRVLLAMSRMADSDIKANALCALCCILVTSSATDDDDAAASYVVEITTELVALTQSDAAKTVEFAVGALYNLACSDNSLSLLVESPRLLQRILELASTNPLQLPERVAALVAATLYRLAGINAYAATMLEHGVFPVLVHVIHSFPSGRTFAVNALYLLAQNGGVHFPHGGDEVAQLARTLSDDTSTIPNSDEPSAATTLLAHLAREPMNQHALVRSDAVFRFLRRLKRLEHNDTVLINCAFVYFSLTSTLDGCEQLVRAKGIEDIIGLARTRKLTPASNDAVKERCMLALCRISAFIGLEARLIEHGAIDAVMITALVATDCARIKAQCIKTLANCLVAKHCVRPLVDHGVIWALASLSLVDSVETRAACAVSLCNLSAASNMHARFLNAGASRALVHLLQQRDDRATVLVTLKAIANLVASEKICAVLLHDDLERHLSAHFADPASDDELRQLAAMVLLRVTSANDAVLSPERLTNGVFVWMEQIIIMKEPALVRNCMLTVRDLTSTATRDGAELDVEHILRIVVQVLERHALHNEIVTLSLTIVYNLSCQRTVLPRLVVPEIMHFLRQHVSVVADGSSDSISTVLQSSSVQQLQQSPTTLSGAAATDVELRCLVLHNMSCYVSSESPSLLAALVSFDAIAIICDVYRQRDDLKEICAIATCNIVVGRVNSARVVEGGAGALLLHFVASSYLRATHYALVSAALRKLTTAPGNQRHLLDSGIASAAVFMLGLRGIGDAPMLNVLSTLAMLSRCSDHVPQLLDGGVLPSVIRLAEANAATSDALALCFEILSNVCSVNFDAHVHQHPEINVISTLTKLSERYTHYEGGSSHTPQHRHQQHQHHMPMHAAAATMLPTRVSTHEAPESLSATTTSSSYLDRGDGHALGEPQLLTFLLKCPSSASSVKKNLELNATYIVPACKWAPNVDVTPKDPPPLVCDEIPLTETSLSIPLDVKQRIRNLLPLPKDVLVRNETADDNVASGHGSPTASSRHVGEVSADSNASANVQTPPLLLLPTAFRAVAGDGSIAGGKKLQRGRAGRNLSHSGPSASRASLF